MVIKRPEKVLQTVVHKTTDRVPCKGCAPLKLNREIVSMDAAATAQQRLTAQLDTCNYFLSLFFLFSQCGETLVQEM